MAGIGISKRVAGGVVAFGIAATAGFLIACASSGSSYESEPGMYNLTGWNGWGGDINGEVGHRLYVGGPTASCRPSRSWNSNYRVLSGSLPPGMRFIQGYNIEGIPTERGHWIISLELYDVECQGNYYKGFTQELRFHITGSGRVVQ